MALAIVPHEFGYQSYSFVRDTIVWAAQIVVGTSRATITVSHACHGYSRLHDFL